MAEKDLDTKLDKKLDKKLDTEHTHMKTWHYAVIAIVLAIIVLAILFMPFGGSALRLPF